MSKGKLRFKGDAEPKKKKKKSKYSNSSGTTTNDLRQHRHQSSAQQYQEESTRSAPASAATATASVSNNKNANASSLDEFSTSYSANPAGVTIQKGEGRITSSGTVLYGHETRFTSDFNAGDAILVNVPLEEDGTMREEMRVITMRLSDISASISSAFTNDLKTPTTFQFIRKPRDVRKERKEKDIHEKLTKEEIERTSFGTYAGGGRELVYRERTEHGSYRIRKEIIQEDATRSDLLNMRSQKKSDKYC
mmetsp:Transcript_11163/g.20901  ORF Transcript_11163/g.20901 Transcript_11163/m.20901 type:complete len:250 (-) Transcript_11163:821-1570(-)